MWITYIFELHGKTTSFTMKPFSLAALFALAASVSALDGYTVPECMYL
jgi:hypothetical protein